MSLRPSQLPKARRQTLRHLRDPGAPVRAHTGAENAPGLDALATALEVGELYWVQQDMAALAMHAGTQLAAASWATADRPSPCGLLYWQDGIGHIDSSGVQIPVEACAWAPYQGEMLLWLLISRDRLAAEMDPRRFLPPRPEDVPPLIPLYGTTLPIGGGPVPFAGIDPKLPQPVVAALAAAWLLMQQPTLVERERECADKATSRANARDGLRDTGVTVVALRRQYTPQVQEPGGEESGRHYQHRWVVSGHWRRQPYGPERSLRRQQWIPAYVKGPDGAPMLVTEKVNVWRR